MTSPTPEIHLVRLVVTMSAYFKTSRLIELATVSSTTNGTPPWRQASAILGKLTVRKSGLLGTSQNTAANSPS